MCVCFDINSNKEATGLTRKTGTGKTAVGQCCNLRWHRTVSEFTLASSLLCGILGLLIESPLYAACLKGLKLCPNSLVPSANPAREQPGDGAHRHRFDLSSMFKITWGW